MTINSLGFKKIETKLSMGFILKNGCAKNSSIFCILVIFHPKLSFLVSMLTRECEYPFRNMFNFEFDDVEFGMLQTAVPVHACYAVASKQSQFSSRWPDAREPLTRLTNLGLETSL